MAVTIAWKIISEFHEDRTEEYINLLNWTVTGTETVGTGDEAVTYYAREVGETSLEKPSDLIPYATFCKQATLIDAVKAKLGATEVTNLENKVKAQIDEQQHPLSTVPPD